MKQSERGEIATIVTISTLVIIAVTAVLSSTLVNKKQTTGSKASNTCGSNTEKTGTANLKTCPDLCGGYSNYAGNQWVDGTIRHCCCKSGGGSTTSGMGGGGSTTSKGGGSTTSSGSCPDPGGSYGCDWGNACDGGTAYGKCNAGYRCIDCTQTHGANAKYNCYKSDSSCTSTSSGMGGGGGNTSAAACQNPPNRGTDKGNGCGDGGPNYQFGACYQGRRCVQCQHGCTWLSYNCFEDDKTCTGDDQTYCADDRPKKTCWDGIHKCCNSINCCDNQGNNCIPLVKCEATPTPTPPSAAAGCPNMTEPAGRDCVSRPTTTTCGSTGYSERAHCPSPNASQDGPWCCKEGGAATANSYSLSGTVHNTGTATDLSPLQASFVHPEFGGTDKLVQKKNVSANGAVSFSGTHSDQASLTGCYVRITDSKDIEVGRTNTDCYKGTFSVDVKFDAVGNGGGTTDCKSKTPRTCVDYCKDNGGGGNSKSYYFDNTSTFYRDDCTTMYSSGIKDYCDCGATVVCQKSTCDEACKSINETSTYPTREISKNNGVWYSDSLCQFDPTANPDTLTKCLCVAPSPVPTEPVFDKYHEATVYIRNACTHSMTLTKWEPWTSGYYIPLNIVVPAGQTSPGIDVTNNGNIPCKSWASLYLRWESGEGDIMWYQGIDCNAVNSQTTFEIGGGYCL